MVHGVKFSTRLYVVFQHKYAHYIWTHLLCMTLGLVTKRIKIGQKQTKNTLIFTLLWYVLSWCYGISTFFRGIVLYLLGNKCLNCAFMWIYS